MSEQESKDQSQDTTPKKKSTNLLKKTAYGAVVTATAAAAAVGGMKAAGVNAFDFGSSSNPEAHQFGEMPQSTADLETKVVPENQAENLERDPEKAMRAFISKNLKTTYIPANLGRPQSQWVESKQTQFQQESTEWPAVTVNGVRLSFSYDRTLYPDLKSRPDPLDISVSLKPLNPENLIAKDQILKYFIIPSTIPEDRWKETTIEVKKDDGSSEQRRALEVTWGNLDGSREVRRAIEAGSVAGKLNYNFEAQRLFPGSPLLK